jgi:hypothetical protein
VVQLLCREDEESISQVAEVAGQPDWQPQARASQPCNHMASMGICAL